MKTIYKPVEMIFSSSPEGQLRPYRFRIKDEEESLHTVKVTNILSVEHTKIAGEKKQIFRCEVIINDMRKICELRYHQDKCYWELFKI